MDDTISRQAAIELADKLKDDFPDDEKIADGVIAHNEGILEYQTALSLLSPAQSERKMGSWKRITEGRIPELYICPFCHRTIEDEGIEYMVAMRYPFCHCGADMRGEQDE